MMKKVFGILIGIILLFLIIMLGIKFGIDTGVNEISMKETLKLIVVEPLWDSIYAIEEDGGLIEVAFRNIDNKELQKLKRGQEIEIYFDGIILTTYPGKINNVSKYKILKEKSDIEIPKEVITFCDNSKTNVMVHVREISNRGIEFRILDTNEIPYEYDFEYSLLKKNLENEEYNNNLTEEYKYKTVWEEVEKAGYIADYEKYKIDIVDSTQGHLDMEGKFDWSQLYGTLGEGEYRFILSNKGKEIHFNTIEFKFVIDENGEATCETPEFGW